MASRFRIVGYRDLRPVDWLSGKRMPLDPGEGHICDRCGAEHAVIYSVEDGETSRRYEVGSSCAKKQFGFDVDREARTLVKEARVRAEAELDAVRQEAIGRAVSEIVADVRGLAVPAPVADTVRYPGTTAWRVGDGVALAAHGRGDTEAQFAAVLSYLENRIRERVPAEWSKISVRLHPDDKSRTMISMASKTAMLALAKIR
jgi:hypothetical protein